MSLCRLEVFFVKICALHAIRTGNDDPATLSDHTSSSNSDTPASQHRAPRFSVQKVVCSLEMLTYYSVSNTFPDPLSKMLLKLVCT